MKKILLYATISALALGLFGCAGRHSKWIQDDSEIADQIMAQIIVALDHKDKQALKKMFSYTSQEDAEDINAEIDGIINFYQGTMQEYKGVANTDEHRKNGENIKKITGRYIVTTNRDVYRVRYDYTTLDDQTPEHVGIYMLEIVRDEDYQKDDFYWAKEQAGVYIPE